MFSGEGAGGALATCTWLPAAGHLGAGSLQRMTRIRDLLAEGPTISFEFFPPGTDEAHRALEKSPAVLADLQPSFVSVTYGAGGSTRERTRDLVVGITHNQPFPAMAHLTCVGHTRRQVRELLDDYAASGVHNILALAGDPPTDGSDAGGDFRYAIELVEFVREHGDFSVGVSAFPEVHPRSPGRVADRRYLAEKLALADFAVTQFFFDARSYVELLDDLGGLGVSTPVIPGLIPVMSTARIRRFCEMNGTAVPEQLFSAIDSADDDSQRLDIAVRVAGDLCEELLALDVPGLHFYTLNRADATERILALIRR